MTHNGLDKKGVLITTSSVVNGIEGEHAIVTEYHKKCVERIIVLEKEKRIGIEDVEIIATPAEHTDPTTIGLKISTPEFTLGYTSDTTQTSEVVNAYKDCDIIILNVQHPKNTPKEDKKKGLSSDEAVDMIKKINPKLAIITHFGLKMVKADPIMEAREIQQRTGIQTIAAKEGMQVNPSSYAAKSQQKKLSSFKN
jgi:ribonuclease BN (tRNA processing enzyme)